MGKINHALRTTDRYFYVNNKKFINEYTASKSVVATWYKEFKMFDKIKPGKTYAQAVLSPLGHNCTESRSQNVNKVTDNSTISSRTGQQNRLGKSINNKVTPPHGGTKYRNNAKVRQSSVAGGWTIDQRQQDPLVLSNKFQMLQNLDEQEHDQATPNVSFGYVSSPIGIKNTKNSKCVRNSPCDNRAKVDDIQELTLAQQEKLPLVGNKNKTGTLVVGAKNIIRPNAQAWSVAHNNTHTSNWDSRLTGNYSPNSMGQGDLSCEFSCPTHAISYSICQHNHECIKQTGGVFGFVPQNNLQLYDGGLVQWDTIPDIIASHYIVKSSGLPNFFESRIPVSTNLNITKWRSYLKHYWDQQLPDLLEYGFPLDFDRNCQLQRVDSNHKSADTHLNHVKAYVQEELSHKAIIGPFEELPGSFHISPLMTRDKQDSDKKRTIMDLSWPKGHSVNNGVSKEKYLGTQYTLHYPSVDNITAALRRIGPGAKLFKVDISRAFRHLRVDPADIDLLGLQVQGRHFIDVSTPFGYRNGSLFFQRCSDAIRYIMAEHGFPDLFNYIDDLIYVDFCRQKLTLPLTFLCPCWQILVWKSVPRN